MPNQKKKKKKKKKKKNGREVLKDKEREQERYSKVKLVDGKRPRSHNTTNKKRIISITIAHSRFSEKWLLQLRNCTWK